MAETIARSTRAWRSGRAAVRPPRLALVVIGALAIGATAQPPARQDGPEAKLLFSSGFEGDITLGAPVLHGNGAWQDISGTDRETGFAWPPKLWGGATSRFQLIAGARERVESVARLREQMHNEIQDVTGHDGRPTRALYSAVMRGVGGADRNGDDTQNVFHLLPGPVAQGDLYVSYWLKLQADLLPRMTAEKWAGRVIADWKTGIGTGGSPGADYRILLSVFGERAQRRLYWHLQGDNVANGGLAARIFWERSNMTEPVPVGEWFRVEMFVHRSQQGDGRVWVAINGHTLFDHEGPNMGVNRLPWNRLMIFLNYSTNQLLPAFQWVDDVEIWDGLPATASRR